MRRAVYTVAYRLYGTFSEVRHIYVVASNKEEAFARAMFEIPKKEGISSYSAWVSSVTYQNGNYKTFNTFEGKPY